MKCPVCGSENVLTGKDGRFETCLACGIMLPDDAVVLDLLTLFRERKRLENEMEDLPDD